MNLLLALFFTITVRSCADSNCTLVCRDAFILSDRESTVAECSTSGPFLLIRPVISTPDKLSYHSQDVFFKDGFEHPKEENQ